jgi:hypothetical protein
LCGDNCNCSWNNADETKTNGLEELISEGADSEENTADDEVEAEEQALEREDQRGEVDQDLAYK